MLSLFNTIAQITSSDDFVTSYNYSTSSSDATAAGISAGIILLTLGLVAVFYLITAISMYKMFQKAGRQDAWAGFVPIYNTWVLYETAGRPGWWALLFLIPFVGGLIGFIVSIIALIDVAKSFGKGTGYALLLIFIPIIGFPMVAFGDARYQGPAGPEGKQPASSAPTA